MREGSCGSMMPAIVLHLFIYFILFIILSLQRQYAPSILLVMPLLLIYLFIDSFMI
jgi:uncharacterized membrane protein